MNTDNKKNNKQCAIHGIISRFDALEWWNKFSDKEKLELSLKYYNVLNLKVKQIIISWRRTTGGEWA